MADAGAAVDTDIGAVQVRRWQVYNETALANAQTQELLSTEVAVMGYSLIAELAEVELGPNGESPADFFYVQVRAFVVNALEVLEEAADSQEEIDLIKASLKLVPRTVAGSRLKGMDVYRDDEGNIVIK